MSQKEVWSRRLRKAAYEIGLPVLIIVVGTLAAESALRTMQMRQPHLVYSAAEALPFRGDTGWLGIYHCRVRNDGSAEVEDLRCGLRVPDAMIVDATVSAPPAMLVSYSVEGDTVWLDAPLLNPGESLRVAVVATAPQGTSDGAEPLPSRPSVFVRGKGVAAVEEPWAGRGVLQTLMAGRYWYVGLLVGVAAGVISWAGIRWHFLGRLSDAVWEWRRSRRPPDFEDDFRGYPSKWKTRDKMSFTHVEEKGLRLWPIPGADVRYALVLHDQPRFGEGTIECEVFLEYGALFDLVVRGDVSDDEFYMARLDSRMEFWDCILAKTKGKTWRECNKGQLSHQTPFREWVTMRVDSCGGRISLYRDDERVDRIEHTALSDGNVAMFAECGQVHVRVIRVWRR
jgi:hypothetical protein